MPDQTLRLLILGAHPDDAEYHGGGLAATYRERGHEVKLVSVTNGASGHHEKSGQPLAALRKGEAAAAGQVIGATYVTWDFPDGELEPTLDVRRRIIAEVRQFKPDLVLTHRPNDYHPDHRAVGRAVQDASYMVTVPPIVPEVPILRRDPVVAYLPDLFNKPTPLQPDVVLDITGKLDTVTRMLACHRSQVFEWLPYNTGRLGEVPTDQAGRMTWLRSWVESQIRPRADRFRKAIVDTYGPQRGSDIEFVEVFEISEYAAPVDERTRQRLFPSVP